MGHTTLPSSHSSSQVAAAATATIVTTVPLLLLLSHFKHGKIHPGNPQYCPAVKPVFLKEPYNWDCMYFSFIFPSKGQWLFHTWNIVHEAHCGRQKDMQEPFAPLALLVKQGITVKTSSWKNPLRKSREWCCKGIHTELRAHGQLGSTHVAVRPFPLLIRKTLALSKKKKVFGTTTAQESLPYFEPWKTSALLQWSAVSGMLPKCICSFCW